ncbi:MAG TPA: PDZ domain-containing protein, partial [Longimicrobium sp.]
MTRLCLLAAAAISLAQAPPAAAQSAPADTLPLALRRRTFEFVWRRVNDTFWDPARLEQRGWTAAHDRYLPRALAAPGTAEFHRVLNEMLSEIGTSHFAVLSPGRVAAVRAEAGTAPGGIGVRLRVVEHTATIVRVDSGSPAARAGLRPGVVVDSIDGRATAESIRQAGRDTASAPVEAPPALAAALNGPAGSEVRLSVHDPGGPLRTLRVTRGPRPGRYHRTRFLFIPAPGLPPRYGEVEARRLEGGIGYVRFSGFIQGLLPEVRRAVASMRDAPGMVLDLRGNPGGE